MVWGDEINFSGDGYRIGKCDRRKKQRTSNSNHNFLHNILLKSWLGTGTKELVYSAGILLISRAHSGPKSVTPQSGSSE